MLLEHDEGRATTERRIVNNASSDMLMKIRLLIIFLYFCTPSYAGPFLPPRPLCPILSCPRLIHTHSCSVPAPTRALLLLCPCAYPVPYARPFQSCPRKLSFVLRLPHGHPPWVSPSKSYPQMAPDFVPGQHNPSVLHKVVKQFKLLQR